MRIEISDETILTADSVAKVGVAGAIWGLWRGPSHANKLGLYGFTRDAFVAKKAAHYGFRTGVFAAVYLGIDMLQRNWGQSGTANDFISCLPACQTTLPTTRYWRSHMGGNTLLACTCCLISYYRHGSRAKNDTKE